jgi:hypothetical protein
MSEPLVASGRFEEHVGWSVSLVPDERIPPPEQPLYIDTDANPWAVSPGLFAACSARAQSDDDLRYAQVMWTVEKMIAWGFVLAGPAEDNTWSILMPDGSTELAYVLSGNVLDLQDFKAKVQHVYHQDRHEDRSYPYGDGGRWGGKPPGDVYGRIHTGSIELR